MLDGVNKFHTKDFIKYFENIDIACLQETKGIIKMENFSAFNSNRPGSRSGGVAILVNNRIKKGITPVKIKDTKDIIAVKLSKSYFKLETDVFLVSLYISPALSRYSTTHPDYSDKIFEYLETTISNLSQKGEVVICGDVNARTGQLHDYVIGSTVSSDPYSNIGYSNDDAEPRNNLDCKTNSYCHKFLDVLINNQLRILNGRTLGDCRGKFTCFKYNGKSVVDYFACTTLLRTHVTSLQVNNLCSYSDHCSLTLSLYMRSKYECFIPILDFEMMPQGYKWNEEGQTKFIDNQEVPEFANLFTTILEKEYSNDATGNKSIVENFTEAINFLASISLTKVKRPNKISHKRWFDRECANSKKNLNRLACNMSRHPFSPELRQAYYSQRNNHTRLIKSKKLAFLSRLNKSIENGHVLDWKKFKNLKQENDNNKVLLDKYDLLSFFEYFSNLYQKDPKVNEELLSNAHSYTETHKSLSGHDLTLLNTEISINEIVAATKKLNLNKSVSEDLLSNEMLKNLCPQGIKAIQKIFNHCLSNGLYPWHTSVITPIYKSGDPYNPDNYRAIAVGSCFGKLFSTILLQRLHAFKSECCPDPIEQLGFTKGAQTNDHILTLKTIIDKYTTKQKTSLITCFVDLRKAFDTVCRDLLLYKIVSLGIRGNFFRVIEDMYNSSSAKIKINNLLSGNISVERGTEQGHPLSPDLFKLFLKDFSTLLFTTGDYPFLDNILVNHLLWADDLVLLALDSKSLQDNLDILEQYCNKWGLAINLIKTKIVIFKPKGRKSNSLVNSNYYIGDSILEKVQSYCYLGVVFHENGNLKVALHELRKKALRALFGMKRAIIKNKLSIKSLFILFDTLVKPVLLYGSQVIAPHCTLTKSLANILVSTSETYLNKFGRDVYEKFHLKFLKWCLSVHNKASNAGCWGETGRVPLIFDAIKLSVDYFIKARNRIGDSLLRAAFTEQKNLHLEWYAVCNDLVNNHGSGVAKHTSINVRSNLTTIFKDKWLETISTSPKLEFYKTFKQEFSFENYLLIGNSCHRAALTRIRISAHDYYIERGRYVQPKIPRIDRSCIYCLLQSNNSLVESERHVIYECPLYSTIRSNIFPTLPNPRDPGYSDNIQALFNSNLSTPESNSRIAKLAYHIQECHSVFKDLYLNSYCQHNTNLLTHPCIIL